MSYMITNRMQRAFIVPDAPNAAAVAINPGTSEIVAKEHWDSVRKGNEVIDALLSGRHLVVDLGQSLEAIVPSGELTNPASPAAPEELKQDDLEVKITSTIKTETIDLDDAPKQGAGVSRKAK